MQRLEGIPGRAFPVYPGDLTEAEWALLAPLLPPAQPRGRPAPSTCDGASTPTSPSCAPAAGGRGGPSGPLRRRGSACKRFATATWPPNSADAGRQCLVSHDLNTPERVDHMRDTN